ncbi:TolC family outer membrane protein [Sneathiella sp.]|jgi:adhesin transport system outer membrane protein|uniref:TolC family outer membrane protein n=1 Tax=Sneathiella sp. TaxID=1964365 RepID=UPI0039E2DAC6
MQFRITGCKNIIRIGVGVAVLSTALVSGSDAIADSLQEDLKYLLENHPKLTAGKQNIVSAEKGIDAAYSGFLPKVSINGDAGWETTDNRSLDGRYDTDRYKAGISVRQNLFQGQRTTADISSAETQKNIADVELSFVTQQLIYEGVVAYLNVERFQFLDLLARDNEDTLKKQLRLEDERVQRGAGIEVDVLQAKSRLQRAIERRVAFQGLLKEAKARYLQVFGKPANNVGVFDAVPPLEKMPTTLDDGLLRAVETNLQIRSVKLQVENTEYQKIQASSDYYPSIDAVARYDWERDVDGTKGTEKSFFTGLELNWEIFSGFLTDARVGQAAARHSGSLASLQFAKQKVEEEVRIAWDALETARKRENLLKNAVNIAAEVFVARQRLRDGGKETALNVLDAENEFYNARIAQVGATYEARAAVYRVLLAIGELSPENLEL